ncbi:hypothetical protein ACQKDB_06500 [Planococcus kocurii]
MDLVAEHSDTLILLDEGVILVQGETRKVLSDPLYASANVQYPHVTEVALELQKAGVPLEFLPIKYAEIMTCFKTSVGGLTDD